MKSHRPRWVLKVGRNTGTRATALVVTVAASMLSAALLQAVGVAGMIHNLNIHKDARPMFQIESFGFRERGFMNLTVSHFSVEGSQPYRVGFIVKKTSTESSAQEELEDASAKLASSVAHGCPLDEAGPDALVLEITTTDNRTARARTRARATTTMGPRRVLSASHSIVTARQHHASRLIGPGQEGLYVLLYCGCPATIDGRAGGETPDAKSGGGGGGEGRHLSSFRLKVAFWNEGVGGEPDYLSAGNEILPTMYFGMFALFLGSLGMWVQCIRKHPQEVYHIHNMMTVLLVFKTLSMLFESIRYHYLRLTGAAEAWSIIYYLFAFLKGITLFVVILLIGTGWSLMKPFLNGRDKRIIFVVLLLQVLNNVAQIVLDEMAPGSTAWLKWRNVLHLVDLVCCCSILFPIVWSIRHLRQASLADGKAENTIRRLNVFRHFYKMVLMYVYFTRIVLVLLGAVLPFGYSWVQELSSEMATLIFFVLTGWWFRPQQDAPYLPSGRDSDEGVGYSIDDEHAALLEMQSSRRDDDR